MGLRQKCGYPQGAGRLIRCETDQGKIIILDSRYVLQKEKMPPLIEGNQAPLGEPVVSEENIPEDLQTGDAQQDELFRYSCGRCGREVVADTGMCPDCKQKLRPDHKSADLRPHHNESGNSQQRDLSIMDTDNQPTLPQIRADVLRIGNTGNDAELLIGFFQHADYEVRRRACSAANKLRDKEITKHILPCLYVPEPQVRQYALQAILSSRCHYLVNHVKKVRSKEEKEYNIRLCKKILEKSRKWTTEYEPVPNCEDSA